MEQLADKRIDSEDKLNKLFTNTLDDLDKQIKDHNVKREKEGELIFDMLKESVDKIKGSIEKEKTDREETERNMLNLLEDACDKLNELSH